MNVRLRQVFSVCIKRAYSSSCVHSPVSPLCRSGNNYRWKGGGVGIVVEGNSRSIAVSRSFRNQDSSSREVLESWSSQSLRHNSSLEETEEGTLKRPPVTTFKKSTAQEVARQGKNFRRRLADNSWTCVPMDEKIIWVDGEMSGLDCRTDKLLEIGVIITDGELNEIAAHGPIIFHADDSVLDGMGAWCKKHHGDSGLTEACRRSQITFEAADEELVKFLEKYTTPGECPMGGNSIALDRAFINYQLPKFYAHFHYRNIDVSTIKELVRRWYPTASSAAPTKKMAHRVLDDIKDSIAELKYYRSTVFKSPSDVASKVASARSVKN